MDTPEHAIKRPAWRTSAFWVATLAILLPLAETLLKLAPAQSPAYVIGGALIAAGFSVSRNLVYKSRNDASAAVEVAKLATAKAPVPDVAQDFISQMLGDYVNQQAAKVAVNLGGMSVAAPSPFTPVSLENSDEQGVIDYASAS